MKISSDQLAKIYFERKPPYQEEAILKAKKEEYKVEYSIQKEYIETKQVKTIDSSEDTNNEDKNPLKKEELLLKIGEVLKRVPDFTYMSEKDKTFVIADIINGKYDKELDI